MVDGSCVHDQGLFKRRVASDGQECIGHLPTRTLLIGNYPIPINGTHTLGPPRPDTGNRNSPNRANPGVSLGPAGEAAAQATARVLAGVELAAIYSSPIDRTIETARILAQPHRLSPILEPGMTEIDFGSWTGKTLERLRRSELWKTVQSHPSRFRFPDGESFVEAQARAVESVERIARERAEGTAAVVSHSDIIKLVLSHFLGQPLDFFQRFRISTASISDLRFEKNGSPAVVSVNAQSCGI